MSTTRYGGLSTSTKQWLMEHVQEMLADGLDATARISRLPEVVLEGVLGGELSAIEYLRVLVGADARGLDKVILEKLAKSEPDGTGQGGGLPKGASGSASGGATDGTVSSGTSGMEATTTQRDGAERPDSPPVGTNGTTVCTTTGGSLTGKIPAQLPLLATDLLRRRVVELAQQETRLRKEYRRLGQEAKDVSQLRKMVRDELGQVRSYLKAVRGAIKEAENVGQKGLDALPLLGITAEMLGLEDHHLTVITKETV
ncbi:hypothetical protein ACFWIN_20925 [Streptomyces sp. NPDC127049]|uniref:hypothetical protein n=1 Tax=Streptomyces sp. NPDC127049 TaxID=3347118 RepID=UPI00364EC8F2